MKEVTKRHTTVSHRGTGSSMQHAPTREVTKRHTTVSHGGTGSSVHRRGKSLSVTQRCHTGEREAACSMHRRGKSLSVTQRCHTGEREAACTDEGSNLLITRITRPSPTFHQICIISMPFCIFRKIQNSLKCYQPINDMLDVSFSQLTNFTETTRL